MPASIRLPSLRQSLQARWQLWWLRRHPGSNTQTLTHRNLYILPTRAGLMLAFTLLLLLVGSINYQLNLGYLLTFLLAGCAVVGMHVSHNNLRGLTLSLHVGDPVFAGQPAQASVTLHNPSHTHRYGIALRWLQAPNASASPAAGQQTTDTPAPVWTDAPALSDHSVQLAFPTWLRGRQAVPALVLETGFPLGTFRVWHWWRPAAEWWVYPAPELPEPPLPFNQNSEDGPACAQASAPVRRSDEVDGVRPYRRGDPLKWVVWKKAARLSENPAPQWVSRDFAHPPSAELWLDHASCGVHDPEAIRSRLCAWVLQAERLGIDYGLRLPGLEIAPGHGPVHQRHCLEALACG